MAVTTDSLLVNISVNTEQAKASLDQLVAELGGLKQELSKTNKAVKETSDAVTDSGAALLKASAAVSLAKEAWHVFKEIIEHVKEPVEESLKAFKQYSIEMGKLRRAVMLAGGDVETTLGNFEEFASQMEESTTVSEEATLKMAAFGKSIGLTDDKIEQMVKTAADLSAITGEDVNSSFNALLGTLKGTARQLAVLDPRLKDLTEQQLRAGKGIDLLSGKFKGFAEDQAKSYGGTLTQIHNITEKIAKEIGEVFFTAFDLKGRSLIDKEMVEQILHFVKEVKPQLMDMAKAVQDAMHTVRSALLSVDWISVAKSVGILTAAFVAFKIALVAIEINAAITAIGGFAAAISAMGGVTGILAQIATFLKASTFIQGAKALALVAAEYLALAVAIAAVGVAIDIVVRNFDKLDKLALVIGKSFEIVFIGLARGLLKVGLLVKNTVAGALEAIAGTPLDVGGTATKMLNQVKLNIIRTNTAINDMKTDLLGTADEIHKAGKDIDIGIAGEGIKLVNNLLKGSADKMKEVKEHAKGVKEEMHGMGVGAEALKEIDELIKRNDSLRDTINKTKMLTLDYLEQKKKAELDAIDRQAKAFEQSGKYNAAELAALNEQLDVARDLVKEGNAQEVKKAPSREYEGLAKAGTEVADQISGVMTSGALSMVGGMATGAGAIIDAIDGLLDFFPNFINKIAGIFDKITDFPKVMGQAIGNLMDAMLRFVQEAIPNLLKEVPKMLEKVISTLFEKIPDAVEQLLASLPELIKGFTDKLPDLVERLVAGIISSGPKMMNSLIAFLVQEGPKIAFSIMKTIYIELPKAIIKGIIMGVKSILQSFKNLFSGKGLQIKVDTKDLMKSAKMLGRTLSGEGSKLFAVMDLANAGKASDAAKDLAGQIEDGMKKAGNWLKELWDGIIKALKDVWMWIWNNILSPIINALRELWLWVWTNVLQPIVTLVQQAFQWVWDKVLYPIISLVQQAFQWVIDKVVTPLVSGIGAVFQWVADNVVTPLVGGITEAFQWVYDNIVVPLSNVGTAIGEGFKAAFTADFWKKLGEKIWGGVTAAASEGADTIKGWGGKIVSGFKTAMTDAADTITGWGAKIGSGLWNKIADLDVGKWGKSIGSGLWNKMIDLDFGTWGKTIAVNLWNKLIDFDWSSLVGGGGGGGGGKKWYEVARGGPIYAAQGVIVPYEPNGTDTVPAMLTPGEFVVNRQAVNTLGMDAMQMINRGKLPGSQDSGGGANITIHMNIKTEQPIDETFIRQRVIPAVKDELKRMGLDGKRLIPSGGVY